MRGNALVPLPDPAGEFVEFEATAIAVGGVVVGAGRMSNSEFVALQWRGC